MMLTAVIVMWILCGWLTCKVEAILCHRSTFDNLWISLFVWPLVVPWVLATQHHCGLYDIKYYVTNKWGR